MEVSLYHIRYLQNPLRYYFLLLVMHVHYNPKHVWIGATLSGWSVSMRRSIQSSSRSYIIAKSVSWCVHLFIFWLSINENLFRRSEKRRQMTIQNGHYMPTPYVAAIFTEDVLSFANSFASIFASLATRTYGSWTLLARVLISWRTWLGTLVIFCDKGELFPMMIKWVKFEGSKMNILQ